MKTNARAQGQAQLNAQAIAHFHAGQLKEAEAICTKILRTTPQQPETLAVLGAIRAAQGNFEEAVKLTSRALIYAPQFLDGHVNRSNFLQQLGRHSEALESANAALAIRPDFVPALLSKGGAELALRAFDAALATFQKVQQLAPDLPMLAFRMGDVYFHLGNYAQALEYYDRAHAQLPQSAELMQNRAMTLARLERYAQAIALCDHAIALAPNTASLYQVRGSARQALGESEAALADYATSIALNPGDFDSHYQQGRVLQALDRDAEALASYGRAVALNSDSAEAHNSYGNSLMALDRPVEAITAYAEALRLAPELYTAHNNYSNALSRAGRYPEALAGYDDAIRLAPNSAAAYCGKGTVLHAMGHYIEAGGLFSRALAVEPDSPLAQFNKSIQRLLFGNFEEGWQLYEARWNKPGVRSARDFTQPLWLGDAPLEGKTILLHAEQGLGDTIQFCRYVPMVEALGARVILEVQPALTTLMAALPGTRTAIAHGGQLPAFDLHCPLMSLPLAFGTTLATLPRTIPYLSAETAAAWQQKLGPASRLRIGLAWSGSKKHAHDLHRSMTLNMLAPLWELGAEFHVLQNEVREQDLTTLADSPCQFHGEALTDMREAAGLIAAMDLVITVDTSLAHLAGALGKPVWILLPFAPDFRWLLDRSDTPWYPTAELLRQPAIGDWQTVVTELARKIADRIA